MTVAGLILAGGGATRLGGVHKPLLRLGAGTVLDEVLRRFRPQVAGIALGVRAPSEAYGAAGLPLLTDDPGIGPMAGVCAGLRWASELGADALLVVPGDTPFIPPDLAARLAPPPAVAEAGGRVHNLVCLLPVMIRPVLAAWLAQGHSRAGAFLDSIAARHVVFSDADAFFNINTPEDLDAARRKLDTASL